MSSSAIQQRIELDIQLDSHQSVTDLDELRRGLLATPRRLPSKYFYDARGSSLFESITQLPEYYPTRAEKALLEESAGEIARLTGAEELVELGAGAATKTRILLNAMKGLGNLRLYVPFDVSATEVRRVAEELTAEYPELHVHGIVADFIQHLSAIPPGHPRLAILLGSTIGNYSPGQAVGLLQRLSRQMSPGDYFLLGTDLIKDIETIEAAYNDSEGITAEFNRNILLVINHVTGSNFDPEAFAHSATYNSHLNRIEMHLVASESQRVELPKLGVVLDIRRNEAIRTEISCKYDRAGIKSILDASGFELSQWYTDSEDSFALALSTKR